MLSNTHKENSGTASLCNKRVLAKIKNHRGGVVEVVVVAVSPSGDYLKLRGSSNEATWIAASDFQLIEVLGEARR